ncbi:MAG: AraC family transcriptional regulator [Ruminococcaceae bacterium]|nr:AraC family transcriptional regulator [Oscillospiraceae bacterium]
MQNPTHRWQDFPSPVETVEFSFHDPSVPDPVWYDYKRRQTGNAFQNHGHIELEVHCLCTGHLRAELDGTPLSLEPGDILIINPYEIHKGTISPSEPVRYIHAVIDLRFFTSLCGIKVEAVRNKILDGLLSFSNRVPAGTDAALRITDDLMRVHEAYQLAQSDALVGECRLTGAVCQLISRLFEYVPLIEKNTDTHRNIAFIRAVQIHIEHHFTEDLTTKEIAAALGYSKGHFCTLFKQNFGVTFTDYLNEYRIEHSIRYLHRDPLSMTEIAARVGFSSYGYFSRSFKKRMGVSPSEYFKK